MEDLTHLLDEFSYIGIAVWLMLAGLGVPLPEDIPLIFGGAMAGAGQINVWVHFFISMFFILLGDSCLYFIGRRIGRATEVKGRWAKIITPARRTKVQGFFDKYGAWTVFFGRFVAGIRGAVFLSAGIGNFPFPRFLLMDFLAALISVPVWIYLGYIFGENWHVIIDTAKEYQGWVLLGSALLVVAGIVGWKLFQRRRAARAQSADPGDPSAPGPA